MAQLLVELGVQYQHRMLLVPVSACANVADLRQRLAAEAQGACSDAPIDVVLRGFGVAPLDCHPTATSCALGSLPPRWEGCESEAVLLTASPCPHTPLDMEFSEDRTVLLAIAARQLHDRQVCAEDKRRPMHCQLGGTARSRSVTIVPVPPPSAGVRSCIAP
jgi:hypothetical protein